MVECTGHWIKHLRFIKPLLCCVLGPDTYYLTIIHQRRSEYYQIIPETKSTIFTELEANNCSGDNQSNNCILFYFILFIFSSETSRNRMAATLKISGSVL